MRVILNRNIFDFLDTCHQLTQEYRTTNTRHILDTDFITSCINQLLGHIQIILYGMNRRISDAKTALRNHAGIMCITNGRNNIAYIVQSTECTGNVCTLSLLYFIEQLTYVGRYRTHSQTVQRTVEHVCLNSSFMKRLRPLTDSLVRIFTKQQVNLFKTSPVCFYTGKTPHFDNGWGHLHQLVYSRYVFSGTLPHITKNQTKFDFFLFHD